VIVFVSAGAATVIGAVVGAGAVVVVEVVHQVVQFIRDKRLEEDLTRGVARVWSKSLCDFDELLWRKVICPVGNGEPATWWHDVEDDPGLISVEDRKRVARVAKPGEWKEIDWAESHVRAIRGRRSQQMELGVPPSLSAHELQGAVDQIKKAALALAEFTKDDDGPKFEWRNQECLERCLARLRSDQQPEHAAVR
jgi:hypothetical protein